MRAELPWNVAGIPPEAREAARAAARREGLSVGEWLTRRIISELGPDAAIPATTGESGPDFLSVTDRRDTEEMLARLAQAEAEASHTYRRIEEQLRSVGSGLDNAERSQSESNRAMSRAASEITLAGQEQAQAFDQLGRHIMGVDERLDKLEQAQQQDALKEAVKGLHQGLARLADQFGQATARTGGQVSSLARNLEQLALRLVQARADSEEAAQALQIQLARMEESRRLNTDTIAELLQRTETQAASHDQDLADIRRRQTGQQMLLTEIEEKLAGQAAAHDRDVADIRQRETGQQMLLAQIEERLVRLEEPDLALEQRLESIEQSLSAIRREMNEPDPHAGLADTLRQVSVRLEILEQSHADLMADFKAALVPIPERAREEEPVTSNAVETEAPASERNPPEAPPLVEEPPESQSASDAAPDDPDDFVQHVFASRFEMPKDFAEALAPQAANEQNLLEDARRSAQAEMEAHSGRELRSTLGWTRSPLREETPKPNYVAILAAVFLLLLLAAAGLMLNLRVRDASHAAAAERPAAVTRVPAAEPRNASPSAPPFAADRAAASLPAVVAPGPQPSPLSPEKVLGAANQGNMTAETVVGLEYLDADDTEKALPWLRKAAEAGQPVAQYRLGTLYERGQGVSASPALAVKWYLAAANQGNRKAMHNLAVAFAEGSAGKRDMEEAARWFAKAAGLGLSDSQFNLAVLYERGDGVPQSLIDAYKWYSIAAAQGDVESRTRLSILRSQLSDADRAQAEHAAQSFQPETPDRIANLPPEPGDIGG